MSEVLKAYLENQKAIRRYIATYGYCAKDAEDLAQESFLKGFAAERRNVIHNPRAFLFRIAKNLVISEFRKKKRSLTDQLEDFGGADVFIDSEQADPDGQFEAREKLLVFAKAVASLPPRCRTVFMLARVENLKYRQIANRLNISISAVEKQVALGLLKCNQFMREHGYEPSEFGGSKRNWPAASVQGGSDDG